MGSIVYILISLTFVGPLITQANTFHEHWKLGERSGLNYHGPLDPAETFSLQKRSYVLKDSVYYQHYFDNLFEDDAVFLGGDWQEGLELFSQCSLEDLNQHAEYIRYLYRLISISYWTENLKNLTMAAYQLGGSGDQCRFDWKSILGDCRARSKNMKTFLNRSREYFEEQSKKLPLIRLKKDQVEAWLGHMNQHFDEVKKTNPTIARLELWCREHQTSCKFEEQKRVLQAITQSCQQDRQVIKQLCNEVDSMFGHYQSPILKRVLSDSNVVNNLGGSLKAGHCLRTYAELLAYREEYDGKFTVLFPLIYKQILARNDRYVEGELFVSGALKEFDDRGLSDFLFAIKKAQQKAKSKTMAKVASPVSQVDRPSPVPKKKGPLRPRPVRPIPPVVKKSSAFKLATQKLSQSKTVLVDMVDFQDDFNFSPEIIKVIKKPLLDYQTRKALIDMHTYDQLGSKKQPMRLIFLKFLIDHGLHQGLYNIQGVLGNQFWVLNDIDGRKDPPQFTELKNDVTTNFRWQLTLLKTSIR